METNCIIFFTPSQFDFIYRRRSGKQFIRYLPISPTPSSNDGVEEEFSQSILNALSDQRNTLNKKTHTGTPLIPPMFDFGYSSMNGASHDEISSIRAYDFFFQVASKRDALNSALDEEMVDDPNVFVMGEEVGEDKVHTSQLHVLSCAFPYGIIAWFEIHMYRQQQRQQQQQQVSYLGRL